MEPDYGRSYERLYREHWWWRAREAFLLRVIQRLPLPLQPNILDVGCGDGLFFDQLSRFGGVVQGLESDAGLVSAESLKRYSIQIGPFDQTFAPNKKYSLILMLDVLEHLPDPQAALRLAVELLEPNGLVVVTVPAFRCLWTTHDDMNHHTTRYTKQSLMRVAQSANFRIDRYQYFFHWLVPLKLALRLKERIVASTPKPPSVPASIVNRTMLAISRFEQVLFGGCPLPMGSSLLAVGGHSLKKETTQC